jgi:vitamin B12 transporter
LLPQSNVGGEVGIDQKLFNDRLTLSATAYDAFYRNLIAFGPVSTCTLAQEAQGGCYYNIGTAQTRGVEVTADAAIVPDVLHARGGYTYNLAVSTQDHINEYRVRVNSGYISLVYTGIPKLEIEPRLLLVGPHSRTLRRGSRPSLRPTFQRSLPLSPISSSRSPICRRTSPPH